MFISYSRESEKNREEVRRLAQRLRGDGVDAWYDGFSVAPPEGAARWLTGQIEDVDFVVVMCTKAYKQSFDDKEHTDTNQDEILEGLLLSQLVREGDARRLIPVLPHGSTGADVPRLLRSFTQYKIPNEYEMMFRHLTSQPLDVPRPLGPLPSVQKYAEWLRSQPNGLDLIGIGGGDIRLNLDEVYVPLRVNTSQHFEAIHARAANLQAAAHRDFELTDLFAGGGRMHALLLGVPGAGKTTALRKLVQQCLLAGPMSIHLSPGYVPIFVRLRRFSSIDLDAGLAQFVLRELAEISDGGLSGLELTELWTHGRFLLLLDGLDEIADEGLRIALCGYLSMQLDRNENSRLRIVVTSRAAGYDGERVRLSGSFARCEILPLSADQVGLLIHRWFAEAAISLRFRLEDARRQAEELQTALANPRFGQRLKVMFSTPLLLTLLCVVVQQGREMPRNRAAFYEECLRVLLVRWRVAKGLAPLLDVDTALALLRPLAYALHSAGRREDLSEDDLVLHLYERLEELGQNAHSALRVLEWLHRDAGVLSEFAPGQYGFFHLGIQEYLAALHVASGGPELLDNLADSFDQKWWHEVARLLISMPARNMSGPLMRKLLALPTLLRHVEVLRDCVLEAAELDVRPFIEQLERVNPGAPRRQVEILRLLMGRNDPALIVCARNLTECSSDAEVRAMAERVLASAVRPSADSMSFDAVLIAADADLSEAEQLAERLRVSGLRIWPGEGPPEPAAALRLSRVDNVRVAVVLVGVASPLSEKLSMISIFKKTRKVVCVLLPGSTAATEEVTALDPICTDFRRGWEVEALRGLCQKILPAVVCAPGAGDVWLESMTGMRFVYVPPGRFQMGCDDGVVNAHPMHWVRLSGFWLGETPVTNRQYAQFMVATKHEEPQFWRLDRYSDPEQPVVGVEWRDAQAFCEWLGRIAGVKAGLPREAQWEYAARGTDGRPYPWGHERPDKTRACFRASGTRAPVKVGSYPAGRGPFGALDQAGNVWEWCEDTWDRRAYHRYEQLDPISDCYGLERVGRGGSWGSGEEALGAAFRHWGKAGYRFDSFGFRVVVYRDIA